MELIKKISIIIFVSIITFSCVQDDDYSVPQSVGLEENENLTQLLSEIDNGSADLISISEAKNYFIEDEVNLCSNSCEGNSIKSLGPCVYKIVV